MAAGSPTKGDISGEPLPTGLWYGDPGPCTTNHNQRSTTIGTADTPVQEMVASLPKEGLTIRGGLHVGVDKRQDSTKYLTNRLLTGQKEV
jgi:hypothetical protein